MAVRPIDGNELYRIEKLLDTDIVRQDKVALNLLEQVLYDIQHVPTLTPQNEWVSVENAVPDPGERVLATDGTFVGEAYRTSANTWYRHTGFPWRDCLQSIVTLWMPLPTADKDNHVPAKAPNEPLTCKGDENGEQRLIDANKILYHQAWESGSMEPANEGVALMSEVQAMPTIDPEALPIVRQLREELERVTAERDVAIKEIFQWTGCPACKHWDSADNWCNKHDRSADSCDGCSTPEWHGLHKEE